MENKVGAKSHYLGPLYELSIQTPPPLKCNIPVLPMAAQGFIEIVALFTGREHRFQ